MARAHSLYQILELHDRHSQEREAGALFASFDDGSLDAGLAVCKVVSFEERKLTETACGWKALQQKRINVNKHSVLESESVALQVEQGHDAIGPIDLLLGQVGVLEELHNVGTGMCCVCLTEPIHALLVKLDRAAGDCVHLALQDELQLAHVNHGL